MLEIALWITYWYVIIGMVLAACTLMLGSQSMWNKYHGSYANMALAIVVSFIIWPFLIRNILNKADK